MTNEVGFDALMTFTCTEMGYCGCIKNNNTLHITLLIPDSGLVTANQFADWVLLADNVNPNVENDNWLHHKDMLKAKFIEYMGADTVEASKLRYTSGLRDSETVNQLENCADEFDLHSSKTHLTNLMLLKQGIFYPVNQIIKREIYQYSEISVCWLRSDGQLKNSYKESTNLVRIIFHHKYESEIRSRTFDLENL